MFTDTTKAFSLTLFGEGGGDGAGVSAATAATASDAGEQTRAIETQDAAAQPESEINVTASTVENQDAEFEKLIKGDYKDAFSRRVQNIINGRFKETRTLQEQLQKSTPVFEILAQKYGIKVDDIDGIVKALENDDESYREEAMEKGITVEQLKEMKKLEREVLQLRRNESRRDEQDRINRDITNWKNQAESLKEIYPNFNLDTEIEDPQFFSLLRNNVDVRTAYEVIHRDEILGGAMQYAAQTAAKRVADSVAANSKRPVENGVTSQGAVNSQTDVNKLTKAQREEIERRVARGERITF
jgi:hypothetical protein